MQLVLQIGTVQLVVPISTVQLILQIGTVQFVVPIDTTKGWVNTLTSIAHPITMDLFQVV